MSSTASSTPASASHNPEERGSVATITALAGARTESIASRPRRTPLGDAVRTLRRNPTAIVGGLVVLTWLILGILAPVLPLQGEDVLNVHDRLLPPSRDHIFGTDDVGREMLS